MEIKNRVIAITGAASGIGEAVAREFAKRGAKLALSDINLNALKPVADDLGALAVECDATNEDSIRSFIAQAESLGPIDLYLSNAGFGVGEPSHAASAENIIWEKNWQLHVMSHVYASRALLPKMIDRGSGYLVNVASAAGLLAQIGDAAYSATKHAAVSFAESLAIGHGDQGVKVSVVCPQYVNTNILSLSEEDRARDLPGVITPAQCAETIADGIESETFMILPHPEVQTYSEKRVQDKKGWLDNMRYFRRTLLNEKGAVDFKKIFKL